jgi:hypothetical protein
MLTSVSLTAHGTLAPLSDATLSEPSSFMLILYWDDASQADFSIKI